MWTAQADSQPDRPKSDRLLAVCRTLVVEASIRLCEARFPTIRRPIVVLWAKERQICGPHRRIRSPTEQRPPAC